MRGTPAGDGDSQAHFKRHVESWGAAGQLHPTEIVEGVSARREQVEDAIEPPRRGRNLECGSRAEPEGAETGDQRDELFVVRVVRDVEKGVLRGVSLSDRSGSARRSPPRHGPLLSVPLVLAGQSLRHQRSELPVAFGRDAEDPGRRGGGGEGRRDHRAGSQSHGLTLRSERFSCQRARKDTCP